MLLVISVFLMQCEHCLHFSLLSLGCGCNLKCSSFCMHGFVSERMDVPGVQADELLVCVLLTSGLDDEHSAMTV